jgi:ParB family chromosome partitioning protein
LAALMGEAAMPKAAGIQSIPTEMLSPGPFQPRAPIAASSIEELTASIRAHGLLQPLLARPNPEVPEQFQIIAGERRWRAAQAAGLHEVPTLIRDLSDAEAMAAALVENLQREDLNAIEEAEGYRRLTEEFGMTQEALGAAVGKSRSHVANMLRLLLLPATVQAEVRHGNLSAGHARALLSHPDPAKAALSVISRGLNVRQTEALLARAPRDQKPAKDPDTAHLQQTLTERLGLKVDLQFNGKGGVVRIFYNSLDQLDGLTRLLMNE